jgi:hypothetical protein
MIADWSRIVRLGLVVSLAVFSVARPWQSQVAWAQDEDDDEGGDEEEEGGDEEEEEDDDQPPVTAGGLFSKENYPISELQRPLTITKAMTELRLGIDVDMSADTAFEFWGIGANARYGLEDNVELQFDFRSDLNKFNDLRIAAALEASIVYDLVDVRVGAVVPYAKDAADGTSKFDFELGFPFRYAPKEQVGVVALDTFMTFNTKGKPDLTPSVGIVVQPVEPLAIKLQAKIIIRDFNTDAGNFLVPASLNIQFSPTNLIDFGGEFSFENLKAEDNPATPDKEEKFYDRRFLLLYGQIRI